MLKAGDVPVPLLTVKVATLDCVPAYVTLKNLVSAMAEAVAFTFTVAVLFEIFVLVAVIPVGADVGVVPSMLVNQAIVPL